MARVLHLADVHFDTTFASRSERVRKLLREGIRKAFVKAVDLAIAEQLDAVLVAGDLFDGEFLSFTTERLILDQATRLLEAGVPLFYATGNHDPASGRGRFARFDWPPGIHVFRSRSPSTVDVLDRDGQPCAVVIGAGHESAREEGNLAELFPVASGSLPHIGLLHTMVQSAESSSLHDRYAPCSVEDLRRVAYDYWALGHIHNRQQVDDVANAWYSGNIQGRNPRETGPRGGLLINVERGKPAVAEFVPLSSVEWIHLDISNLDAVSDATQLEAAVRKAFDTSGPSAAADDWIVVVELTGHCPLEPDLRDPDRRTELEHILADTLSALDVELRTANLSPPIDVDAYRGQTHLLSEALAVIGELVKEDRLVARMGPEPLANAVTSESKRSIYLRSLLEGLEEEAVIRLLAAGDEPK